MSPGYPNGYAANESCYWDITVESKRELSVQSEDLQLRGRDYDDICATDYVQIVCVKLLLILQKSLQADWPYGHQKLKACGSERINTTRKGRVYVKFTSGRTESQLKVIPQSLKRGNFRHSFRASNCESRKSSTTAVRITSSSTTPCRAVKSARRASPVVSHFRSLLPQLLLA